MTEAQEIPTDIPFTDDDVATYTKPPRVKPDSWFYGRITNLSGDNNSGRNVTANGHLQLVYQVAVLDEDGEVAGPKIRDNLTLPHPNPNPDAGQKNPPNTTGLCRSRLNAMGFGPFYMAWKNESGDWEDPQGNELSSQERTKFNEGVNKEVWNKLRELYADPEQLVGAEFFFLTVEAENNGQKYTNIKTYRADEPEDADVEYEDFVTRD